MVGAVGARMYSLIEVEYLQAQRLQQYWIGVADHDTEGEHCHGPKKMVGHPPVQATPPWRFLGGAAQSGLRSHTAQLTRNPRMRVLVNTTSLVRVIAHLR